MVRSNSDFRHQQVSVKQGLICFKFCKKTTIITFSFHSFFMICRHRFSHTSFIALLNIFVNTFSDPKQNTSSKKFLSSLGVVLFQALDFGLKEDEERTLENNLEKLIEDLTSADKDIDSGDEGIERDSDESSECGISLNTVLEVQ